MLPRGATSPYLGGQRVAHPCPMSDVVPHSVAVRVATEVLVNASVLREFLPAQRSHVPGGRTTGATGGARVGRVAENGCGF